jgi:hypothetical protein
VVESGVVWRPRGDQGDCRWADETDWHWQAISALTACKTESEIALLLWSTIAVIVFVSNGHVQPAYRTAMYSHAAS